MLHGDSTKPIHTLLGFAEADSFIQSSGFRRARCVEQRTRDLECAGQPQPKTYDIMSRRVSLFALLSRSYGPSRCGCSCASLISRRARRWLSRSRSYRRDESGGALLRKRRARKRTAELSELIRRKVIFGTGDYSTLRSSLRRRSKFTSLCLCRLL
jgi:hypothetical protein